MSDSAPVAEDISGDGRESFARLDLKVNPELLQGVENSFSVPWIFLTESQDVVVGMYLSEGDTISARAFLKGFNIYCEGMLSREDSGASARCCAVNEVLKGTLDASDNSYDSIMNKQDTRGNIRLETGYWVLFPWGLAVLVGLLSLSSGITVWASTDIFMVLSSEAEPYRQAAAALEYSLSKRDITSRVFLSEDLSKRAPDFSTAAYAKKIWVAIGPRAAVQLHGMLPVEAPLVYCMVADPEKIGLGAGDKNRVGVSVSQPVSEQFAIIQEALPELRRIAMLYRSSSIKSMETLVEVESHLPDRWTLLAIDVDTADSMAEAIEELFRGDVGLIWTMADEGLYKRATVNTLLLSSLRKQVPVFGFSGSFVVAGALLGLDADPTLQGEYAAALVVAKLRGKVLPDSPRSSGVTVVLNMVVAQRLGVTFPEALMEMACILGETKP